MRVKRCCSPTSPASAVGSVAPAAAHSTFVMACRVAAGRPRGRSTARHRQQSRRYVLEAAHGAQLHGLSCAAAAAAAATRVRLPGRCPARPPDLQHRGVRPHGPECPVGRGGLACRGQQTGLQRRRATSRDLTDTPPEPRPLLVRRRPHHAPTQTAPALPQPPHALPGDLVGAPLAPGTPLAAPSASPARAQGPPLAHLLMLLVHHGRGRQQAAQPVQQALQQRARRHLAVRRQRQQAHLRGWRGAQQHSGAGSRRGRGESSRRRHAPPLPSLPPSCANLTCACRTPRNPRHHLTPGNGRRSFIHSFFLPFNPRHHLTPRPPSRPGLPPPLPSPSPAETARPRSPPQQGPRPPRRPAQRARCWASPASS
jgi:hypothetical protein